MHGVRIVERDDNKGCKTTLQLTTPLEKSALEAETEVRRHLTLAVSDCQSQCHPTLGRAGETFRRGGYEWGF